MPINQRFVLDENLNAMDKLNPHSQKGYCHKAHPTTNSICAKEF
jgi:hypothetical protein